MSDMFPPSSDPHQHSSNPQEPSRQEKGETPRKLPEFIIIEEDSFRSRTSSSSFAQQSEPSEFRLPTPQRVPLKIRFLCLIIGIIAVMWTIGAFVTLCVTSLFAGIAFGQSKTLNQLIKNYWNFTKKGLVVSIGLLIAIFSPQLGFILIVTYFLLQGQSSQKGFLSSLLRSSFHDYIFK